MARPLNQSQMLAEAIPAALGGQFVIVTSSNQTHARELGLAARGSLADSVVRAGTNQGQVKFTSGGELNFIPKTRDSVNRMRGYPAGPVYLLVEADPMSYSDDHWELCTIYDLTKSVIPRVITPPTRFERILMDDAD
jgi:hypothetical protein